MRPCQFSGTLAQKSTLWSSPLLPDLAALLGHSGPMVSIVFVERIVLRSSIPPRQDCAKAGFLSCWSEGHVRLEVPQRSLQVTSIVVLTKAL